MHEGKHLDDAVSAATITVQTSIVPTVLVLLLVVQLLTPRLLSISKTLLMYASSELLTDTRNP